jgi:diguanylate cyclase
MQVLTDRGVEILIDDFGIGNSSLSYLKHLPAKTLKIDRSFVEHIEESQEECAFLESIIELALSRNKSVVVEGIETAGQAALIRQMKPVKFQGYYFSRPVPADEFERLVRSRTRLPVS